MSFSWGQTIKLETSPDNTATAILSSLYNFLGQPSHLQKPPSSYSYNRNSNCSYLAVFTSLLVIIYIMHNTHRCAECSTNVVISNGISILHTPWITVFRKGLFICFLPLTFLTLTIMTLTQGNVIIFTFQLQEGKQSHQTTLFLTDARILIWFSLYHH